MKIFFKYVNKLDHQQKALIATILVELFLIFLMFQTVFPTPKTEKELTINFIEDDFDFEELKQPEKKDFPDIDKIIEKAKLSTQASNEWLEKNLSEENQTEENTEEGGEDGSEDESSPAFEELAKNKPGFDFKEKKKENPESSNSINKSFTGKSTVEYYVPNRYKTRLINPVYTCPDYMHGRINILIVVDRQGNVTKAVFDPENSTTDYGCLVETAIKYALRAKFNTDTNAPEKQTGYIKFTF